MAKKSKAVQRELGVQQQVYVVSGHLDVPIDGSTSFAFEAYARNGEDALRKAKAAAARYNHQFTMELCRYVLAPHVINGASSHGRILRT